MTSLPPPPRPPLPHEIDQTLLEPYTYIDSLPGKNIRTLLIDAFDKKWLKVTDRLIKDKITNIINILHNSSLLIDDIEDDSKLRRGCPVAHSIFGVPQVINTANYMYFLSLEMCESLGESSGAMRVFVSELLNLHRGQGQDILWRDTLNCPTFEQYEKMVLSKTGGLFRLAIGLLQCFSSVPASERKSYIPLVDLLALYFQIRDDLVNLADEEYMKSKSFCEDFTEGKFSFPIIHCVLEGEKKGDHQLRNILKLRTADTELKRYAQTLLLKSGSFAYTRTRLSEIKSLILNEIESLGGHDGLVELIEMLDTQVKGVGGFEKKANANATSNASAEGVGTCVSKGKAFPGSKSMSQAAVMSNVSLAAAAEEKTTDGVGVKSSDGGVEEDVDLLEMLRIDST